MEFFDEECLRRRYGINDLRDILGALADYSFKSSDSVGRRSPDRCYDDLWIMDQFLLDILKIEQSKAYRRLPGKTQVFVNTGNCHVSTRLRHTAEVKVTATIISQMLGLNSNLCQAIAAGHDLGHGPFGHLYEQTMPGFKHNVFSVVLAQHLERGGLGLNLSFETLEGISLHSGSTDLLVGKPLEYTVVRWADKISYIFSDINDAIRNKRCPQEVIALANEFGANQRERTQRILLEAIVESARAGRLVFDETELGQRFLVLQQVMFEQVYYQINHQLHQATIMAAYEAVESCYPGLGNILLPILTDHEVVELTTRLMRSQTVTTQDLQHFSISEIVEAFQKNGRDLADIKISNLDLEWSTR